MIAATTGYPNGGGGRNAPGHSSRPAPSLMTADLIVFGFFVPDTNGLPPGLVRLGAADLHFGAVDPQPHPWDAA